MAKRARKQSIKFTNKDFGRIINGGLNRLLNKHPRLQGIGKYLESEIDSIRLSHAVQQIYDQNKDKGYTPERLKEYIINSLGEGIAEGGYFNETGQKLILEEGKKEYGNLAAIVHPVIAIKRKLNPDYLDRGIDAFSKIYDVMKAGNYQGVIPETLTKKVEEMKEIGLYNAMIDIFYDKKIIPGRAALYGKGKIREKVKKNVSETLDEMKTRLSVVALLASSFFLLGFSANNMTGFVIAGNKIPSGYPIGVGFVLLTIAFCLSFLRRKGKKAKQVKRKAGKIKGKSKRKK